MSAGEQKDDSVKAHAVKWIFGQETNTVVLMMILLALGYGFWWAMTTGVPKHLTTIQEGYERLNDRHEKSRADDRMLFKETLDRIERRGMTAAAKD